MLRVFGYESSINVRKVLWTCEEIGIPFEREDWGGETRSTAESQFLAMNPVGLIPVINDDGLLLWESNTIVRYLAASRNRVDLLPLDARQRALVERWMDWQASDFNNSWRYAYKALVQKHPAYGDMAAAGESVRTFTKMVGVLDRVLGREGPYIAGAHFTVADIVIGLSIHRWHAVAKPRAELEHVARYYELLSTRQGFRRYGLNGGP